MKIDRRALSGYDFLDFGSSKGGCIRFAENRLGGIRGLGVDNRRSSVEMTRTMGYDCIEGDITNIELPENAVRFVTLSHVLEHLPDLRAVRRVIESASIVATDFLFIQGPWFDGDAYLESLGLKLFWSDWHGHPCHLTTSQLKRIFSDIRLVNYVVMGRVSILTSADSAVHPLSSPRDQHGYDVFLHPKKPQLAFDRDIYSELVCYVQLRPLSYWDDLMRARTGCRVVEAVEHR